MEIEIKEIAITISFLISLTLNLLFFWFYKKKSQSLETKFYKEKQKLNEKGRELVERKKELIENEKNLSLSQLSLINESKKIVEQIERNLQKEKELSEFKLKIEEKMWEISQLDKKEAQEKLLAKLKEQVQMNLENYTQREIQRHKKNLEQEITKLICSSLERYSTDLIFNKTVNHLTVENKDLGRIIGKDGRNINFFRKITGTEIIVNKKEQKSGEEKSVIEISSFNSLRREIATLALNRLIKEKRLTPLQIESVFQEVSQETEELIFQSGEEVCRELQINLNPELTKYLGKLRFRTSYGQNVLEHCLEVAKLAGCIAAELNLEVGLAKRAGLLHDIGKAMENEDVSHVKSGIILAKQYQEPPEVINAIASHHRDFPADNLYSLIVSAADTLSAARPGARGLQLEAYIARMESLEELAKDLPGIDKIYAFQAGREIWVMVNAKKVNDHQILEIYENVKKTIQERIVIPGEITVSVLRETKIVKKITSSKGTREGNSEFLKKQRLGKNKRKKPLTLVKNLEKESKL